MACICCYAGHHCGEANVILLLSMYNAFKAFQGMTTHLHMKPEAYESYSTEHTGKGLA